MEKNDDLVVVRKKLSTHKRIKKEETTQVRSAIDLKETKCIGKLFRGGARMLWPCSYLKLEVKERERMIWRTSWLYTLRHVKALSEKGISTLEVPRDCNLRRDWNRLGL